MSRSVRAALLDIWEAIDRIQSYAEGADAELTRLARVNFDALLYNLLIVSEASRQVPDELKSQWPDLPWREIATTGNVLRHHYFRVDRKIIAVIIWHDLPNLKNAIGKFWGQLGFGPLPPP